MRAKLLAVLVLAAGIFAATSASAQTETKWQACEYSPGLPITVSIGSGVNADAVRHAMNRWNDLYGGQLFVETSGTGAVSVVSSTQTWASMPCDTGRSTFYVSPGFDTARYAHELGHTLAFPDYVWDGWAIPDGYINPRRCPSDGYVGIMSYCGDEVTMTADDERMVRETFPATSLASGWSLVSGTDQTPSTFAARHQCVTTIYEWTGSTWRGWFRGAPELGDLSYLHAGTAYWVYCA